MAEPAIGTFSDYTQPRDGVISPWAVGINAFMGGAQYGADRDAIQAERKFAGETRDRARKQWITDDEYQKGRAALAEEMRKHYETLAPKAPAPDLAAGAVNGAMADVRTMAPPAAAPAAMQRGVGASFAAPGQTPPVAAPAVGALPQSPRGTAPAMPQGVGASFAAPAAQAPQNRMSMPSGPEMNRLKFMESIKLQDLAERAGRYEDADKAKVASEEAYNQYATQGVSAYLAAVKTGDVTAVRNIASRFPDLHDGFFEGEFTGAAPAFDPTTQTTRVLYHFNDGEGKPLPPMTIEDVSQVASERLADPKLAAGVRAEVATQWERQQQAAQKGTELKDTRTYRDTVTKEEHRRNKEDEAIRWATLGQQEVSLKSGNAGEYWKATNARLDQLANSKQKYASFLGYDQDSGEPLSGKAAAGSFSFVGDAPGKQPDLPFNQLGGPRTMTNPDGKGISLTEIESAASALHQASVIAGRDMSAAESAELTGAALLLQRSPERGYYADDRGDVPIAQPPTIALRDRYVRLTAIAGPNGQPIPVVAWTPRTSGAKPATEQFSQAVAGGNYMFLRPADAKAYMEARLAAQQAPAIPMPGAK